MHRRIIALTAGLGIALTGCAEPPRAAQPPAQQDALTQTTATPTPVRGDGAQATSSAVPDEAAVTSAAPSSPEESGEGASAGSQDPFPDGPPEMPQVAWEHTEEGAAAFAEYYMELINYTGLHPEVGILEPYGGDDCKSCANYENNVKAFVERDLKSDKAPAIILESRAVDFGSDFQAFITLDILAYTVSSPDGIHVAEYEAVHGMISVFTLTPGSPWVVQEIQGRQ